MSVSKNGKFQKFVPKLKVKKGQDIKRNAEETTGQVIGVIYKLVQEKII